MKGSGAKQNRSVKSRVSNQRNVKQRRPSSAVNLMVRRSTLAVDGSGFPTAQHYDNASTATRVALDKFFHSDLASEPDNFNKEKVRVDLGVDPTTGERLYTFHPRRAQKASCRQQLPIFRRLPLAVGPPPVASA